ncbi:MAG TPA: phosphate signaling complex protein PhoU [Thermodesulfobacteriaceae bacterium]|nr:phosphate signaling complex protein PhoU [Thermodesulfobacteriaceae bacterium]
MGTRIGRTIAEIKNMLLQMSKMVEEAVRTSILAYQRQDLQLAQRVIEKDEEIDTLDVRINSLILKTLALQQPMAADFRFLTSAMLIGEQLERVGDHAVNIAEQVTGLIEKTDKIPVSILGLNEMAAIAVSMLGDSINAFVYGGAKMAEEVRARDKEVDDLYISVVNQEIDTMATSRSEVRPGVYHIILAINIERIADLATNIAEDIIFLVEGRLVRHTDEYVPVQETKQAPAKGGPCPAPEGGHREPLECLENHANHVHDCLAQAALAVKAYFDDQDELFTKYVGQVGELEQAADMIKRNVRAHLPRGIIMPIDKFELFLYLNEQDGIADTAEDMLEWITYRKTRIPEKIREGIDRILNKSLEISKKLPTIIHAARTYFQTGDEDVRIHVKDSIRNLRTLEHEADVMEHELKKQTFALEQDAASIYYFIRLIELVGKSADQAENAVDVLRSMIAK